MIEGHCHCGALRWELETTPTYVNACNCEVCSRYGVLWAYGSLGTDIRIFGDATAYVRAVSDGDLAFCFCPTCGGLGWWRGSDLDPEGRAAVNLRLADPEVVAEVTVRHFDGAGAFAHFPDRGTRVKDVWA